jgi:hypothetical protein
MTLSLRTALLQGFRSKPDHPAATTVLPIDRNIPCRPLVVVLPTDLV